MSTSGHRSLSNFYRSVAYADPRLAAVLSEDIIVIALYALGEDKVVGQAAVDRLRMAVRDLPEIHRRVLENALTELGYS